MISAWDDHPPQKTSCPACFQAGHFWAFRRWLRNVGASETFRLPGGGASHGGADGDDLLRVHLARVPAISQVRSHPHDLPFRDRADIHLHSHPVSSCRHAVGPCSSAARPHRHPAAPRRHAFSPRSRAAGPWRRMDFWCNPLASNGLD